MTQASHDQNYSRRRRRPSFLKRFFQLLIFFFGVTVFFTITFFLLDSLNKRPLQAQQVKIISPLGKPLPTKIVPSGLSRVITESLAGTKGTYAIAIKNLKTGEEYFQNEHLIFDTASLYKLWVMLTVYSQLKDGTIKEETTLRDSVENLNRRFAIASDSAELKEGAIAMTVNEALTRMITVSHNYPALLLSSRVRLTNVNAQLLKYNLTESKLNPSKSTAFDIAKFYELLYKGELIDRDNSNKMIALLTRQQLNDRIPKYLPKDIKVAHKTGELDQVKHDAGIVYSKESGDYIIVMMSRSTNPLQAAERQALLSKDIYDYFLKANE